MFDKTINRSIVSSAHKSNTLFYIITEKSHFLNYFNRYDKYDNLSVLVFWHTLCTDIGEMAVNG